MSMVERSSFLSRFTLGLLACLAVTVAAVPEADAQAKKPTQKERDSARDAYNSGTAAYDKGDYTAALEGFQKANSIIPSPHAQYWIAMSFDKAGKKDEAIKAFDELLANPDVAKIGDEKQTTAKNRVAELKKPPEPEPAPPPVEDKPPEPPPEETPPPPPTDVPPAEPPPAEEWPPAGGDEELEWTNMLGEIGLLTGPIFISSEHNLHEERYTHSEYSGMAWLLGLRAGFFPIKYFGIEAEYAHGWGSVETPPGPAVLGAGGDSAQFNTVRGHLVGQAPVGRFVPFGLVGAGVLQATSDRLGADGDFLLEFGIGAKFSATKLFTPRLDIRFDLTQKEDGSFSDGVALHPEILLGLGLTLGR